MPRFFSGSPGVLPTQSNRGTFMRSSLGNLWIMLMMLSILHDLGILQLRNVPAVRTHKTSSINSIRRSGEGPPTSRPPAGSPQCRARRSPACGYIVPLKYIECGVYGDLIIIYPKPYSIYLRRTTVLYKQVSSGPATQKDRTPNPNPSKKPYAYIIFEIIV